MRMVMTIFWFLLMYTKWINQIPNPTYKNCGQIPLWMLIFIIFLQITIPFDGIHLMVIGIYNQNLRKWVTGLVLLESVWVVINTSSGSFELTNTLLLIFLALVFTILFSEEPIKALLSLIAVFLISILLTFVYCQFIFLPLIILIIYVGAIAVLFLFVIMMCKHTVTNQNIQAKNISILLLGLILILSYPRLGYTLLLQTSNNSVSSEFTNTIDINLVSSTLFSSFPLMVIIFLLLAVLVGTSVLTRTRKPT